MKEQLKKWIGIVLCAVMLFSVMPVNVHAAGCGYGTYTVKVSSGYLALRTAMVYDSRNEIGKLYTGDTVQVQEKTSSQYWYVYAPSLGKSGYVNCSYLYTVQNYTVKVSSGYLALRSAMAYDSRNEIGKLYTGNTVQVIEKTSSQYWYVYAPSLGKYGYVNCSYLYTVQNYTVSVSSGYLALRSAMAYDSRNEIGKLYSGSTVQVIEKTSSQYWYVYAPSLGKYGYVNCDYLY